MGVFNKEATNEERYRILDQLRTTKLERARLCSHLTQPSLLPPEGYGQNGENLPMPFSSAPARGVTTFASRLLSALIPLNDIPFFRFALKSGVDPSQEVEGLLNTVTAQVYRKLVNTNLRETVFQALQHLIVTGDVLMIMEDDFAFRTVRMDQFCVRRNLRGEPVEIIWLEYSPLEEEKETYWSGSFDMERRQGFETLYIRALRDNDTGNWEFTKQNREGEEITSGNYEVPPFQVIGWIHVTGDDWSRSHCEENIGDISALDAYSEMLQQSLAAGASFWMGVDPAGTVDIDDIEGRPIGSWVGMRPGEVFTVSTEMRPQIDAADHAVERMGQEVGQAFLSHSQALPSGDRVTATAVRFLGADLETVTGGAFSAIARRLFEFIIDRTVFLMLASEELDPRLAEQFFSADGELTVEVVTGLQALTRDTELTKLLQMGEMVRNLPEKAQATFKWSQYTSAVVSTLGFDSTQWIKSEEEVAQEAQAEQAEAAALQAAQQAAGAVGQGVAEQAAPAIAEQVVPQLGGVDG